MSLALIQDVVNNGHRADHCPLCGVAYGVERPTTEHIIPKWIQERYALRDRLYTIPSRLQKRYASAIFPICRRCNNEVFSEIEAQVRALVENGASADDVRFGGWMERVALWSAKLLWLMALKSNSGVDHRSAAAGDPEAILDDEFVRGLQLTHMVLRAGAAQTTIASWHHPWGFMPELAEAPYSAYVFEIDTSDDRFGTFDYIDNPAACGIALRLNRLGVICVFDAGHHNRHLHHKFADLYEHPLHPLQFQEVVARVFYDQTCLKDEARTLTYFWNEPFQHVLAVPELGHGQAYGEELHDPARLAEFLGRYTLHDPKDMVSDDGRRNWTSLYDTTGAFMKTAVTDEEIEVARLDRGTVMLPVDAAWRRGVST